MSNSKNNKVDEFLDNVILMRMEADLDVLGKRLGYATKKKDEMAGTKKWWKLVELTKDERHGINPLTERGEAKKKQYAELEKKMKKEGEEIFYEDMEKFNRKAKSLFKGNHSLLLKLTVLTYIKFCQNVYSDGLSIEKQGETFEEVELALFDDTKIAEKYFTKLRLTFGKISSLPKIDSTNMANAIGYVLKVMKEDIGIQGASYLLDIFGFEVEYDDIDINDLEGMATKLALSIALIDSTRTDPYFAVYANKFYGAYFRFKIILDGEYMIKQNYVPARKMSKIFHRFEDEFLDVVCA